MKRFGVLRDVLICGALLVMPFFFLSANLKAPEELSPIDEILMKVSAPIQSVSSWSADLLGGWIQEYVWLRDTKAENDRVRSENARLRARIVALEDAAAENRRLRSLLDIRGEASAPGVAARVIARDISQNFRVIRVAIDRGLSGKVRPGMPVVSGEGLVGEVRRSSGRYSDILLTTDAGSRVDVLVKRTGARGRLEGMGDQARYRCRVQFDRAEDEVSVGDALVTSGLGKKYPPGILVGHVAKMNDARLGLVQVGEVAPAVDFSRLQNVWVLPLQSIELD